MDESSGPPDSEMTESGEDRRGPAARETVLQPVQEYLISFEDASNPLRFCTHLGSDYGIIGPGEDDISWRQGVEWGPVCVEVPFAGRAGMWHSLAGPAAEKDYYLDFTKCYPYVRDEYQPECVGMVVRVRGTGILKLELRSPEERILWWATRELSAEEEWQELRFSWSPADLRRVKSLTWVAEPGARLSVDSIRLIIEMPDLPFELKVFLASYAKLARCYSPSDGMVKDRADQQAGERDSIPASGLFCLATCAAWKMGVVKAGIAEQTLRKTHATVSGLPRAKGLLPHYIRKAGAKRDIDNGVEYSTLATSIYYHSVLLAAQMLWDGKTLANLIKAVREIEFDQLLDSDGYALRGLEDDGRTPLPRSWREWSGETALVLLLEHMAAGWIVKPALDEPGKVPDGVGAAAEIESLFYLDFYSYEPDAITGVSWLHARRTLLEEQKGYFPRRWSGSEAARLGLFGLSAGAGPRGVGYVSNGPGKPGKLDLIHPHYILMSALLEPRPAAAYDVLRTMEAHGLFPPWGLVENFTKDLEYLPMLGSLNAAYECISAYHLWAAVCGERDQIYDAAEHCPLLREAARMFFPPTKRW